MPSNFDIVIGQKKAKEAILSFSANNRLSHAYLLWGNEGIGKDALAIEFAKTILCENSNRLACGECSSCKKMESLQHPNLTIVFPLPGSDKEKDKNGEKVDNSTLAEVRTQIAHKAQDPYYHIEIPRAKFILINSIRALKKESSLSASGSGKKVFLIFDADAMNDAAANALLKVLEEPLEGTCFVLTTSRKDMVKDTILSRCQLLHCTTLSIDDICTALMERDNVDAESAQLIARLANGSYRRAKQLLGEDFHAVRNDSLQFLRNILGSLPVKLFEDQDKYMRSGNKDDAEQLLMSMLVWFRDAMVLRENADETVVNIDQSKDLHSFLSKFGAKNIEQCMTTTEHALELLRRNVYLPLVILSFSVQIRQILHAE